MTNLQSIRDSLVIPIPNMLLGYDDAAEMIDQNIVEREMREEVLDFYNNLESSVDGYGRLTI
jgi:hypothetical protein